MMENSREMQEMVRRVTCGQITVVGAQAGRVLRGGRCRVARKMAKVDASMERTIKLQLKLTPRKTSLAMRTRIFTFWIQGAGEVRAGSRRGSGSEGTLTRSLAFSLSVSSSRFSKICSSWKVGLSGFSI